MKISSASTFFIAVLLFLSFSLSLSANKPKCNPHDQKAIDKIIASFGLNPIGDCCDWEFVSCQEIPPYRVTTFEIINSAVVSQFPAAVGDLSALRIINIYNVPNFTGNIPPTITNLTELISLTISKTGMSDPIPAFPVNLKNLTTLDLSYNSFTGSIPLGLSRLSSLKGILLQGNKLTGTIPGSLARLSKTLQFLFLSQNLLAGTVPKSIGNLDLIGLDLFGNNFIGDASFLFGKNKRTLEFSLHDNKFKFDLSKVEFPAQSETINLSHNYIFGSFPQNMTQYNFLTFDVSYNRLCGEIPQGGRFQLYGADSYVHNKCLCGSPLPACK